MQARKDKCRVVVISFEIMWKIGNLERRVALVLLAAASLATAAAQVAIPAISSSVLVFGPSDYVLNGGQSRCQTIVQNALANKQSTLMFVPTAFWVDDGYASLKTVNSQVIKYINKSALQHPLKLRNLCLTCRLSCHQDPHCFSCSLNSLQRVNSCLASILYLSMTCA